MVRPSLSDQLVSTIRERILCGEILPGVHLVEQELAADFGVGRPTVREALRRLLADAWWSSCLIRAFAFVVFHLPTWPSSTSCESPSSA